MNPQHLIIVALLRRTPQREFDRKAEFLGERKTDRRRPRMPKWLKVTLIVVAALILVTVLMLILSTGGHDTNAHAATYSKLPHCTKKHPCTKKQARRIMRATNHGHDSRPRSVRSLAVKRQVRAASSRCRTWRPRIYYEANAGRMYWRGAVARWCFDFKRVTRATFSLDHDITTGGRILGFDQVHVDEPTQGYYNYGRRSHGGYLIYARFTFTQCIPVIKVGPFCDDRRAWLKEFVHFDGSGYASGQAP